MPLTLDTLAPFLSDCIDALAHWSIQPGPLVTTDTTVLISKENSSTVFFIHLCLQRGHRHTDVLCQWGSPWRWNRNKEKAYFYSITWKEKKRRRRRDGRGPWFLCPLYPIYISSLYPPYILLTHSNPPSLKP